MSNHVFLINLNKIECLARKQGMSLTGLENDLGLGHGTIVRWKRKGLAASNLGLVAERLEVKVDDLLEKKVIKNGNDC